MPDTLVKAVKQNLEELGEEIKDEAKRAVTDVVSGIPKQILGTDGRAQQPLEPPTNQEVIEHLYGATGKKKMTKRQVTAKAQKRAIEDAKRRERIRQALKQIIEPPQKRQPTEAEILEMEKRKEEEEKAKKQKEQSPPLVEPAPAPKKGIFGLFLPRGKKGKVVHDLQTSVEKKVPEGGIA